jgi:hypothetical protein
MVMMERFGNPQTRIMSVMKSFQIPVRSVQPVDKLLVITDGAMHFGIGYGADRGKINSILRLEGIIDYITMTIDDTVVCEKGQFKI